MKKFCPLCCGECEASTTVCGFCLAPFPDKGITRIPKKMISNNSLVSEVESALKGINIVAMLSQKDKVTVYLAENPISKEKFAVKVVTHSTREEKQSLLEATGLLQQMQHPGVAKIYQYGALSFGVFIKSEYLVGRSLRSYVKEKGRLSSTKAASITGQVLTVLVVLHKAGIVHRNLRPENIYLRDVQGDPVATLLGFSNENEPLENLNYASPEQLENSFGPHSDLYSLGVVFFELITGRLPFIANTTNELQAMIRDEIPPTPSAMGIHLPKKLERLLLQSLEKHPQDRPASALDFGEQILASLAPPLSPKTNNPTISKPQSRLPSVAVVFGVFLVGFLLGFVVRGV
jgi:serine/threonine protein kinase